MELYVLFTFIVKHLSDKTTMIIDAIICQNTGCIIMLYILDLFHIRDSNIGLTVLLTIDLEWTIFSLLIY